MFLTPWSLPKPPAWAGVRQVTSWNSFASETVLLVGTDLGTVVCKNPRQVNAAADSIRNQNVQLTHELPHFGVCWLQRVHGIAAMLGRLKCEWL